MSFDGLVHATTAAVAMVAAHEGTALGTGDSLDELVAATVKLGDATRSNIVDLYAEANRSLHRNWTRRVGTPGYVKRLWMDVDRALTSLAQAVAASVGHTGPLVVVPP